MQTSRLTLTLLVACCAPAAAMAQAIGPVGEDARVAPRGAVGIMIGGSWSRWAETFGRLTPAGADGKVVPLGARFSFDSLGSKQLQSLAGVQQSIRSLAALPGFAASLGTFAFSQRNQIVETPVGLKLGLWGHVELSATAPLIEAHAESRLGVNPTGSEGNVSFNPARGLASALAGNANLLSQFDSAAAQVNRRLVQCAATPAAAGCSNVNANAATARALVQDANTFANAMAALYGGRTGGRGALFVPVSGTPAQTAIEARIAAYRTQFATFGSAALTGTGPYAAAPFSVADAATLLSDSAYGFRARPLATAVTRGMGDVELGLKLKLFDTFGDGDYASSGFHVRQSVGVTYRMGTGKLDSPDDFTDLGTGQHQNDIELRAIADVGIGRRFFVTLFSRYNMQGADSRVMRVSGPGDSPLVPSYREHSVQRNLGDELELALSPRLKLNGYVTLWGGYAYRSKSADAYRGSFQATNLDGAAVTIDASVLNAGTEETEQRLSAGATFSTVDAWTRGTARLPLEVSFAHYQSVAGTGGLAPKLVVDQVRFTVYRRLFGR